MNTTIIASKVEELQKWIESTPPAKRTDFERGFLQATDEVLELLDDLEEE
jgi:hypothetical protein